MIFRARAASAGLGIVIDKNAFVQKAAFVAAFRRP
jgi:hypothetical protein